MPQLRAFPNRLLCVFLFGLMAGAATADDSNVDESCCVDQDIAVAFLQHATYSRGWPSGFPIKFDSPNLELIGSSSSLGGQQIAVAWKSELSYQEVHQFIVDELTKERWLKIPHNNHISAMYARGFIPHQPVMIGNSNQFCRDRDGQLTMQARSTSIGTVVTLSHYTNPSPRNCMATIAALSAQANLQSGLLKYLPALRLPESITTPQFPGSGSGGGSNDAHASVFLETDMPAENVLSSFEKQMNAQGWRMDADFQGTSTSGHTWRRDVDGLKLVCFVTAAASGNDKLRLRMHLEPL
ncbi:MAG: hypothetical protein AAF993_18940 [Pseudomonadota bacterium]